METGQTCRRTCRRRPGDKPPRIRRGHRDRPGRLRLLLQSSPRRRSASRATASAIDRSPTRSPAMQKLGLRSCELWQDHVEPRKMPRDEMRRWRETVSLDHFHRVRDQFAKASIALSAYNISIQDNFSDAEIERALRHDDGARRAADHVVVQHQDGGAHRAGGRAAQDAGRHAQPLAHRSERVRDREEPDRRAGEEPLSSR